MDFLLSSEYTISQEILKILNNHDKINEEVIDKIVLNHFKMHSKKCNDFTKKLIKQYSKNKLKSYELSEHFYKGKYKCGCIN
jgi:hydrogenase maturation factor